MFARFSWKRLLAGAVIFSIAFGLLAACESDDDPLSGRKDPAADGAAEVPGSATPIPHSNIAF
ncbi:MAG TPA: hypothetical protein VGG02_01145 [Chthoniobacterales bacterium]|jgi:hypothetical protein